MIWVGSSYEQIFFHQFLLRQPGFWGIWVIWVLKSASSRPTRITVGFQNFCKSSSNVMPQTFTLWKAISTPLHKINIKQEKLHRCGSSLCRLWVGSQVTSLSRSPYVGRWPATLFSVSGTCCLYSSLLRSSKKAPVYQLYQFKLNLQAFVV